MISGEAPQIVQGLDGHCDSPVPVDRLNDETAMTSHGEMGFVRTPTNSVHVGLSTSTRANNRSRRRTPREGVSAAERHGGR